MDTHTDDAGNLIPIYLGITGHRDLRSEDMSELEKQIRSVFIDMRRLYPSTPIVLLSPLAEGADRLAAKVALEEKVSLIVPLPLPREEYEKDFGTGESRKEFAEQIGRAQEWFHLPLMEGNTSDNIKEYGEHRDLQYALAGTFIVRHCQVLIALWDGVAPQLKGGTAEIVQFKLAGVPEPYSSARGHLDRADCGPVYHIVTPRISNPSPEGTSFSLNRLFPAGFINKAQAEAAYARILSRIDRYNQDIQRLSGGLAKEVKKNKGYVIPEDKENLLSQASLRILETYAVADTLAIHFQRRRHNILLGIFVAVIIAVFFFHAYLEFFKHALVLALYPLMLVIAFILYFLAKQHDYQDKHIEYRTFAEGLRVKLFWKIAGIHQDVSDHYLRKHFSELEWIKDALRTLNLSTSPEEHPEDPEKNVPDQHALRIVYDHWVRDQCTYFAKASKREEKKLHTFESQSNILFWAGFGLSVLAVFAHHYLEEAKLLHQIIIFSIVMSLALAAAIKGYSEKMAISEQAKQYSKMSELFERANHLIEILLQNNDLSKARKILLTLGKEALAENGDWVILHRSKPIEVPKG